MTESLSEAPIDLVLEHPTYDMKGEHTLPANFATPLQHFVAERRMWNERTPSGSVLCLDLKSLQIDPEANIDNEVNNLKSIVVDGKSLRKTDESGFGDLTKKRFAAIVIATDALTPESSGRMEAVLKKVSRMINIQKGQKGKIVKRGFESNVPSGQQRFHMEEIDVESKSGVVMVVEDKGDNTDTDWRKKLMQDAGLRRVNVIGKRKNSPVMIWEAGRKRESIASPIDATQTKAGPKIASDTQANLNAFDAQGIDVDHSLLVENQKASRMVPGTMENSEGFNGVTFQDTTTGDTLRRDLRGNEYVSDVAPKEERDDHRRMVEEETEKIRLETLDQRGRTIPPYKLSSRDIQDLLRKKGGFTRQDLNCPGCGAHPVDKFSSSAGEKRFFLYIDTVCEKAHPDGYPHYFEGNERKYLGSYGTVKRI